MQQKKSDNRATEAGALIRVDPNPATFKKWGCQILSINLIIDDLYYIETRRLDNKVYHKCSNNRLYIVFIEWNYDIYCWNCKYRIPKNLLTFFSMAGYEFPSGLDLDQTPTFIGEIID